jgi:hypothetical protein
MVIGGADCFPASLELGQVGQYKRIIDRMAKLQEPWPDLPLQAWQETCDTLHMWSQIVGKIRLGLSPFQNHWWHCALYVNTRGLTTSPIPYKDIAFGLQFNFLEHRLELETSSGVNRAIALARKSVAAFYRETFGMLHEAGIDVKINTKPQEVAEPIPLDQDETHKSYDSDYANRLWRILLATDSALKEFRGRFIGKSSPVHFFWGSFDLCASRFSGRRAPPRKGAITSEAYSHECHSVGWWPGGGEIKEPAFYAYMAPEPQGFGTRLKLPLGGYNDQMHEFILAYADVRRAKSPPEEILEFAQRTYEAGADLAGWDRTALERDTARQKAG